MTDKSEVFDFSIGETGAPMINEAKLTMECTVEDIYETKTFENFILEIKHTYVEEAAKLTKEQKQALTMEFTETAARITGLPQKASMSFSRKTNWRMSALAVSF